MLHRSPLTAFGLALIALVTSCFFMTPSAFAQSHRANDVPATYTGAMGCPQGSFLDIGLGSCWTCPQSAPARTIFPVTGPSACERPLHEEFKRASGPRSPKGLIGTDCDKGWFLDIGKGLCYSCNGYNRTLLPVTHQRACARWIDAKRTSARLTRESAYCPEGSFQHVLSGRCYACPKDYDRNLVMGDDPSTFNACSLSNAGIAEDLAMAKLDEMGPQMMDVMLSALTLSNDADMRASISEKGADSADQAAKKVGANPCALDAFNAWTLGVTAGADAVIGVAGETGMAVDIRPAARRGDITQRNAYWYAAGSWSLGANAGASGGVSYGCWVGQNNGLGGNYQGFSVDPFTSVKLIKAFKAAKGAETVKKAFETSGASVSFGVWFDDKWNFLGVTITPAYGRGISLAGYSKGGTLQFP